MTVAERLSLKDNIPAPVIRRHIERYQRALVMAGRRGGTWLDAACGTGYGTGYFPASMALGIDRDPLAIAEAGRDFERSDVGFRCADILALPVPDDSVDVVVSVETFEHLSRDEQPRFLDEVARVLVPAGILVLTCPLREGGGPNPLNPHHLHEPSMAELVGVLQDRFTLVTVETEWVTLTTGERQEQAFARAVRG